MRRDSAARRIVRWPSAALLAAALLAALLISFRRRRGVRPAAAPLTSPEGIRPVPEASRLVLAVIGDFGRCHGGRVECARERAVAGLVDSWSPDYILTTGDNNYPAGEEATLAVNLDPYRRYVEEGRFLPALGNHDWGCAACPAPHLALFRPPGNGRYYALEIGDLGLWVLDSDEREPDGIGPDSVQARWLRDGLARSAAPLRFVILHHPPYSSGHHGSSKRLRWPFAAWGADAVFSGHEHSYERLEADGIPYFVNGSGGARLRGFRRPLPATRVRYAGAYGAQRIEIEGGRATIEFRDIHGRKVDALSLALRPAGIADSVATG